MRLDDEHIRGRTVISGDGIAIGEISRVYIDGAAWRVESLQVKLRRESAERLGTNRSLFHAATIEIPTALVQSVGDAVVLRVPLDELRAPETPEAQPSESAPTH